MEQLKVSKPVPSTAAGTQENEDPDASVANPQAAHQLRQRKQVSRPSDFRIPYSLTNTLTLVHSNSQPNLTYLRYFDFDPTDQNHSSHPLDAHLLHLTWLQLLEPELDSVYSSEQPIAPDDVVASWKPNRRGTYHRRRRRWARTRHTVDATRAGGFSGLVVAATMDPISILRHTLPLLAGGAPIAIYSASLEPLAALADCFSVARRAAWVGTDAPPDMVGKTAEELERWEGTPDFPLNPALVLGPSIQTSRARKWQVLPGRTHPIMTARGGAEGYVFTGWRALPAEGKIEARGKYKKRKLGPNSPAIMSEVESGSPMAG